MQGRFKTKHQAQNMRRHSWICLNCGHVHTAKPITCLLCQKGPVQYFPSQSEVIRYGELRLKEKIGVIKDLKLQPTFPVDVNHIHVTTYRADFRYRRADTDALVIEDVKGSIDVKHLDPVFVLKRKLVEALYGVEITLIER